MRAFVRFAVFSLFLSGGIAMLAIPETQAFAKSDRAGSPRSLYVQNCARCHGSNGKSQTDLGMKLDADDISGGGIGAAKITRIVTNGKGDMPGFKKKLTPAQIAAIAGYVRTL